MRHSVNWRPAHLLLILLLTPMWLIVVGRRPADNSWLAEPDLATYPWVFLRDGRSLEPDEEVVSLIAVGDVLLGRGVAAESDPFGLVAGWVGAADITLGNLEGVLVDGLTPRAAPAGELQPIILGARPRAAALLAEAGFDVLGLANNHGLDYGSEGIVEAAAHLDAAGVDVVGLTEDDGAPRPLFRQEGETRLAILAFNAVPDPYPGSQPDRPGPARWNPATGLTAIRTAKAEADAVIVSIHWGFEYEPFVDPAQEAAARSMMAAGADLIVGHHPHVAQAMAVDGDRLVAFSLGNFLFDQGGGEKQQGLALQAFFDGDGLRAARALPVRAGTRPQLMTPTEAEGLLSRVAPPPERLGFRCDQSNCQEVPVPRVSEAGLFYGGQVDLTGDGRPEIVRREDEGITIYEQGRVTWESPADWRVVDAALGDPNDDGRYEIMLAIWRKDEAGYERSQPYMVGHRGGVYKLLWGGRPLASPIQEMEIADVDGDQVDELLVVEALDGGSERAISVWQWAGWTFTLQWRSQAGRYRDLVLSEGEGERPLLTIITGR